MELKLYHQLKRKIYINFLSHQNASTWQWLNQIFRGMDTLSSEVTVKMVLPPTWKGSTLKGKNLLQGSKFFPFRVDPFSEGLGKQVGTKIVSLLRNGGKPTKCIISPEGYTYLKQFKKKKYFNNSFQSFSMLPYKFRFTQITINYSEILTFSFCHKVYMV